MKPPKELGWIGKGLLGLVSIFSSADKLNAEDKLIILADIPTISQMSYLYNYHNDGASEGNDGADAFFIDNGQAVKFYSRNPLCSPDRLKKDVRPLESMTTYTNELEGVNLSSPTNVDLVYWTNGGFEGVNVISRITNGAGVTEGIYDAKQLASHYPNSVVSVEVDNGITRKVNTEFYATADCNIDGRVDLQDYQIIAANYGRTGVTQTDTYDANNFADINRDGNVDMADMAGFSSQWLYDKSE